MATFSIEVQIDMNIAVEAASEEDAAALFYTYGETFIDRQYNDGNYTAEIRTILREDNEPDPIYFQE